MTVDNISALRARDDLLAVAAAWPALRARLRPSGGSSEIRTPPDSKPPIDITVSDTMRVVEDRTRFYARVLLEEVPPVHGCAGACHGSPEHRCGGHICATDGERVVLPGDCPERRNPITTSPMPGLLEQVATQYGHFLKSERMALDFLDDAHEMRRKVAGVLASHEPAKWQGPCPEAECVGELYLRAGATDAKCRDCGRMVGPVEWRRIMEIAFADRLMTVSELVSALVVTGHYTPGETRAAQNTVRTWIHRGRLPKAVADPDLYSFATAHELAELRAKRKTA